MPDLGEPQKKKLDLSGAKNKRQSSASGDKGSASAGGRIPTRTQRVTRATQRLVSVDDEDDDEELDDDDEIISSSLKANQGSKFDKRLYGAIAAVLVLVVVLIFVLMNRGGKEPVVDPAPTDTPTVGDPTPVPSEDYSDPNVGFQDFTGNTNMTSDSPLSNPDGFIEDINGLTTRVEYEVTSIQSAVDFVNYTKRRGTWGGGLELYWLDCTYKDKHYVVQIPFQYYKELDDTGIVPVKMEVLYSKQPTGEMLTIISYMSLDEQTLKTLLKSKK